jgi:hypothetical protein
MTRIQNGRRRKIRMERNETDFKAENVAVRMRHVGKTNSG